MICPRCHTENASRALNCKQCDAALNIIENGKAFEPALFASTKPAAVLSPAGPWQSASGNRLALEPGTEFGPLREFFVGQSLTGADIQMSFVGEMAKVFEKLGPYPNLAAWLTRMHARPAFVRSVEKGGAYRFAK